MIAMRYLHIKRFFRGIILFQCMFITSIAFAGEINHPKTKYIELDSTIMYTIDTLIHPTCADSLGGSIEITTPENAIYIYEWKKDTTVISTEQDIDSLSVGIYTLTIQDTLNDCIVLDTFTLSLTDSIELQINFTNSCFGANNGTAVAEVNPVGEYTYLWSNDSITNSISDLSPDTYTVTVTSSGGCVVIDSVTIEELAPIELNIDSIPTTCYGDSNGIAIVTIVGDITDNYTYLWSNGATTDTTTNLIPDSTYYVTVTDSLGCMAMNSVLITQPDSISFTLNATSAGCSGNEGTISVDNLSGGTGDYTISWSHDDMLTESIASNLPTGIYNVTVTDDNDCMATIPIEVGSPNAITLSISSTDVLCFEGNTGTASVSVGGGTGSYTYEWDDEDMQMTATANNLSFGDYIVTVTDGVGCVQTADITVNEPDAITLSVSSTDVSCFGENDGTASVSVSGGTGGYTYEWDDEDMQMTATAVGLSIGTYTVVITDANNCMADASVSITEPNQIESVSDMVVIFQNSMEQPLNIESTAPILSWEAVNSENIDMTSSSPPSGISQNNTLNLIYTLADSRAPGQVTLNVSPQDGDCEGEPATVTIQIFPDGGPVFIPEVFTPNGDGFNDEWEIRFNLRDNPSDYAIKIFSRNGQKVYEAGSMTDFWDAEGYPDGAYYYIIMDKNNNTYKGTVSVIRE